MSKTLISNNFDNKPKYFAVSQTKLLLFNIFYKNNKIYLIMPIYNEPENANNIHVTINNNILPLTEKYIKGYSDIYKIKKEDFHNWRYDKLIPENIDEQLKITLTVGDPDENKKKQAYTSTEIVNTKPSKIGRAHV